MRVELVGFSQGVSFVEKDVMLNYLDFKKEDGTSFRIPVPEESMQALLKVVYANGVEKQAAPEPEPLPEGAEEFGGDFDPDAPTEQQEPQEEPEEGFVEEQVPQSEDEVPSV